MGWRQAYHSGRSACGSVVRSTVSREVCARVTEKLEADWSPQQIIAGWLQRTYPKNPDMQVSHETIYLSLFVQSRGVLKKALIRHLRRRKTMRRSQHATTLVLA